MTKKLSGTWGWAAFCVRSFKMGRSVEVLLVEDDDSYARLVLFLFEQMEYSSIIDRAANGVEAIKMLGERFKSEDNFYDIVITDIHMNFINGIELTKYIRSFYSWLNIPIVVMSSQDETNVGTLVHNAGANRFMQKPAHIDELLELLTTAIVDFVVARGVDIELAHKE
ncbi:response regulator [Magnetospirillum sp. SS-4]|uniref:response regulator n=1 Tax=Magnetospirillum sp. SS-4 TaxID=2681465 RepID=UPI0015721036|nr:response regulator [Magnetospirillum sp. SS-4]